MFTKNDFKVELMNSEVVKDFIRNHGEFACVCYNTPTKYANKVGETVLEDGHFSGSRADFAKFKITKVPRYAVDQCVRHEQGVVKNVQSQRYVDQSQFDMYVTSFCLQDEFLLNQMKKHEQMCRDRYEKCKEYMKTVYPKKSEEFINDQLRTMLPIGCESCFNFALNLEGIIHFMHKRLCMRADEPIRIIAQLMRDELIAVEPRYKEFLVPQCEALMYCPEKHTCGKLNVTKDDLRKAMSDILVEKKLKELGE